MSMRDDAIFLAGVLVGTYGMRDVAIPACIQPVIDRIIDLSVMGIANPNHIPDATKMVEPIIERVLTAQLHQLNDEEKIAAHIEQHGVITPKRTNNVSPENRAAQAQRMRDMQARKKAERESGANVTITVEGKPLEDAQIEDWRSRPEPEIHKRPDDAGKLGEYFNSRENNGGND